MPWRTLIEGVHLIVGLGATAGLGALFAWSYPQGTETIWIVAAVAGVIVAAMGVRPIRRAMREDAVRGKGARHRHG